MNATIKLDDRISAAFTGTPSSDEIAALLTDVSVADDKAKSLYADAKERALDPATPATEVTKARKAMDDCEFASQRMSNATARLNELLATIKQGETETARQHEFDAAVAERDQLAAEMAEEWPELELKIVDLLTRVAASNARLSHANNGAIVRSAEAIARNAPADFDTNPASLLRLVECVRLPAFVGGDPQNFGYAWPKLR